MHLVHLLNRLLLMVEQLLIKLLLAVKTAARYLQWNINSSSDSQANGEFGKSVLRSKILERYVFVSNSEIKAEREQSDQEISMPAIPHFALFFLSESAKFAKQVQREYLNNFISKFKWHLGVQGRP